jgi:hypothetical protein
MRLFLFKKITPPDVLARTPILSLIIILNQSGGGRTPYVHDPSPPPHPPPAALIRWRCGKGDAHGRIHSIHIDYVVYDLFRSFDHSCRPSVHNDVTLASESAVPAGHLTGLKIVSL